MKRVPNIITISRMFLSALLLVFLHQTMIFIVIYLLCGLSDILDGAIARRTNTRSELGAKLDSMADLIFFSIITACFILLMGKKIQEFIPLTILIIVIRIINISIAAFKYHKLLMLHTRLNKITGGLVFFMPVLWILFQYDITLYTVLFVAVLSALEET
ncbi:MAG TPA: CDP-alcohol phosphatidyltransferase family protein, partial [Mobilitalea sp.]|nr:CDP-alcohol phosphatidyltransferase family protein [Mobilitalea sp.]